jgi:hypothetical protein
VALDKKGNAICDLSSLDATAILLLNNTRAKETSALDDASLTTLLDMAFYARGIHLYHGNASLLAESLEVIQQTSAVILAALEPSRTEEMADAELAQVA